jgi:hypothetical protein
LLKSCQQFFHKYGAVGTSQKSCILFSGYGFLLEIS